MDQPRVFTSTLSIAPPRKRWPSCRNISGSSEAMKRCRGSASALAAIEHLSRTADVSRAVSSALSMSLTSLPRTSAMTLFRSG